METSVYKIHNKILETMAETQYYAFLRGMVEYLRPRVVVELGTDRGASTLSMLSALKNEGVIYTVDIVDKFPIEHKQIRKYIGNDLGTFMELQPECINLLFIDSDHTGEHVKNLLDVYLPLVKIGGVVALDDIELNDSMRNMWKDIEYPKLSLSNIHKSGFGFFIKDK